MIACQFSVAMIAFARRPPFQSRGIFMDDTLILGPARLFADVAHAVSGRKTTVAIPTNQSVSSLTRVNKIAPDLTPYLEYLETRANKDQKLMGFSESTDCLRFGEQFVDTVLLHVGLRNQPQGEKFAIEIQRGRNDDFFGPYFASGPVQTGTLSGPQSLMKELEKNNDRPATACMKDTIRNLYAWAMDCGLVTPSRDDIAQAPSVMLDLCYD